MNVLATHAHAPLAIRAMRTATSGTHRHTPRLVQARYAGQDISSRLAHDRADRRLLVDAHEIERANLRGSHADTVECRELNKPSKRSSTS